MLLEGVLDVDDVVEQARAGELGHEQRAEVELGHDLGAAGAQEAALPDLAEALADHEVLTDTDTCERFADAPHAVDLGAGEHVVQGVLVEDHLADVRMGWSSRHEQVGDERGVLVVQLTVGLRTPGSRPA